MIEKHLEIAAAGGTTEAILYAPDTSKHPGLLFYTDIFGIRPANQDMAKRAAEKGYAVLMPNVFYRYGKPPFGGANFKFGEPESMKLLGALFASLTGAMMEQDAPHYVKALLDQPSVSDGKIAVVGYCYTGAMALRTAAVCPNQIAAAASFHGGQLVTDAPDSPHTRIPQVKGELYFGHAIEDQSMPPQAIETLDRALKSWGGKYQSEIYDGAKHGWTVPGRDVYNEKQAERHYQKLFDLMQRTL
jgi:carboxymethylenebutenolidase